MVLHDQDIGLGELRLSAELALSPHFRVALSLPLRIFATSIRYVDTSGTEVQLTGENIHHRDENLVGLGDPWLSGVWATGRTRWSVAVRAGVSLPVGGVEPDPFALGDMGLAHEHFQFGTGTFDPLLGVDVARRFTGFQLGAFALTKQALYANREGYHAGDRYMAGVHGESALGTRAWSFRLGGELQGETAERWHGVVREDEGNLGRVDVMIAAGARWRQEDWSLEATLRVPVYEHVIGGQIDVPAIVELGATWSFDAWGGGDAHAHEHGEHEHEHHHDEDKSPVVAVEDPDLDVLEYVKDGSAPELVPVAGKITVFDFWAPWCQPCKALASGLRELSMRFPDRLAVRMVNVVDWDSAAAARWLTPGGLGLPHVKIYDATGRLVDERSGSPESILHDVEALLRPSSVVPTE